jgi:hypothetical protein
MVPGGRSRGPGRTLRVRTGVARAEQRGAGLGEVVQPAIRLIDE